MDEERVRARLQAISVVPHEERSDELEELIGILEGELESTSARETLPPGSP